MVLHAGDIVSAAALAELESLAPTVAVLGNNDHELLGRLPTALEIELAGVRIAMTHDSGASSGRARRLQRRFPAAGLVVFGHSHSPMNEEGQAGQSLFNPGSPTQRRAQPRPSFGHLELADATIVACEVELL
jgi:putative phosphoesterase